ncbi:MAG: hypothetical protein GKS07_09740 [Nitrosopumilus sp.]|nr:MAG: hypothetical protein GKS07_09740 [Nitrosopumilus sp.]
MTTTKKKFILASLLAISMVAMFGITQQQISAEETNEKQYVRGNDVEIYTVFSFRESVEESGSFQIFEQLSGFDRVNESAVFKLEGAVNYDRIYLYEAADMTFVRGVTNVQHDYGQFDVDVYLQKDGVTFRQFEYSDCNIVDYHVSTQSDKEEGWTTSKGFTTIDEFEFECNGYTPNNPLFDQMNSNVSKADTQNSMDLKDTQTWSDVYK